MAALNDCLEVVINNRRRRCDSENNKFLWHTLFVALPKVSACQLQRKGVWVRCLLPFDCQFLIPEQPSAFSCCDGSNSDKKPKANVTNGQGLLCTDSIAVIQLPQNVYYHRCEPFYRRAIHPDDLQHTLHHMIPSLKLLLLVEAGYLVFNVFHISGFRRCRCPQLHEVGLD